MVRQIVIVTSLNFLISNTVSVVFAFQDFMFGGTRAQLLKLRRDLITKIHKHSYLGCFISNKGEAKVEVKTRIGKAISIL